MAKKPFHESIIDVINALVTVEDVGVIAVLLRITVIPEDHDKIIEAWTAKLKQLEFKDDFGVIAAISGQKK